MTVYQRKFNIEAYELSQQTLFVILDSIEDFVVINNQVYSMLVM